MKIHRLGRTLVAAVIMATVALPYANPVLCDAAENETGTSAQIIVADHRAWSPADDCAARCRADIHCCVALVAVALEHESDLPTMPTRAERSVSPQQLALPNLSQPPLPPPRV